MEGDRVARFHRQTRGHLETLKVGARVAYGFEAGLTESRGNVFCGAFETAAAVSPSFKIVGREKLHVLEVDLRIDSPRIGVNRDAEKGNEHTC